MKNSPEYIWRGVQACGEVAARCWCRGKGSWGNLGKIGTWTLRILGYQPAGRHLESSYLNPFEVRVSCRGIGQRVWRAEKILLLLPMPPTSLSLPGVTSSSEQPPAKGRGSPGERASCAGTGRELEHLHLLPAQGWGRARQGRPTGHWIESWRHRKSKGHFMDKKTLLIFFSYISFIFPHFYIIFTLTRNCFVMNCWLVGIYFCNYFKCNLIHLYPKDCWQLL